MRCALAVLVCQLAACDVVFGIPAPVDAGGDRDGKTDDASLEPVIATLALEGIVAPSESTRILLDVIGPPGDPFTYSITADRGIVADGSGVAALDDNGLLQIAAMYTAPATSGPDSLSAVVGGSLANLPFDVASIAVAGFDTILGGERQLNADILYAIPINFDTNGELRRIGMRNGIVNANVRFGFFDANGNLLARTDAVGLTTERVTMPTTHVPLSPGTYFIAVMGDSSFFIGSTDSGTVRSKIAPFGEGMPQTLQNANAAVGTFTLFIEYAG